MTDIADSPPAPLQRVRNLLGNSDARGIIGTMLLKIASAVVAFALFSLAANAAGAEEFGRFSILFSAMSILSIVAAAGQEMQVVRSWSEYLADGRPALALGALRYGWFVSLAGVFAVSLAFWIVYQMDTNLVEETIKTGCTLALAAVAFMATNTLSLYSSHAARAIVGIKVGDAHYELTWRSIAILFLAASLIFGHSVTTTQIMTIFALGLTLVIVTQNFLINKAVHEQIGKIKPDYNWREWTPRSFRLWLAAIMEASNQHMEVFLIGILLDPLAAGAYFVAARLANSFALATSGLNTFGTRRIPKLYYSRDVPALKHTLRLMAGMSLIIVAVGLLTVILAGEYMLLVFGRTYMDYYWVLLILSIGTGMNAANGPAPSMLMLTGHEGRYMKIVTGSVVLRIIGFFVIIPYFGILGAAAVTATVNIGMAMLVNFYCRHLSGMDPSILRFLHESPDVPPGEGGTTGLDAKETAV